MPSQIADDAFDKWYAAYTQVVGDLPMTEKVRCTVAFKSAYELRREPPRMDIYYLAQLRHAYSHLVTGSVIDQKQFAELLLAPAIEHFEKVWGISGDQPIDVNPDSESW